MKQFFTFLFILSLGSMLQAQVFYSQDFEDGFGDMILVDNDGLIPAPNVSGYPNAWNLSSNLSETQAAISNSWYSPPGVADDWMITPVITGTTGKTLLRWTAKAQDPQFPDGYQVLLSPTGSETLADFTVVLFEVAAEAPDFTTHDVDLGPYAGTDFRIAFRNNSSDKFLLVVDDIQVIEFKDNDISTLGASTPRFNLVGSMSEVSYEILNNGNNTIESFDFDWSYNGQTISESVTGVNIPFGETYTGTVTMPVDEAITYDISFEITSVNGGEDENTINDGANTLTSGVSQEISRKLLAEEGTGTWCPWCPRGTVFMARMAEEYGDEFVGIAVHNTDPMAFAEYDDQVGNFPGFSGYPGVIVNRENVIDPGDLPEYLINVTRNELSPVSMNVSQTRNGSSIDVEGEFTFYTRMDNASLSLVTVVLENGVTGTGSDWDQANAYADNQFGSMGGYENLPNPVPASQMIYNGVARELLNGFYGDASAIPSEIMDGTVVPVSFSYEVPSGYDYDNVYFALFIVDDNTGRVVNSDLTTNFTTNAIDVKQLDALTVFPNPASEVSYVRLDLNTASNIEMSIVNSLGQIVGKRAYGELSGDQLLPIDLQNFKSGIYYIRLNVDGQVTTEVLTIQK